MITILRNEIKKAMIEKDVIKRDLFRMVLCKAEAIAKNKKCDINDEIVIQAGNAELKQINQTLELTPSDSDLGKETLKKKEILIDFLPKMLSEDEIRARVKTYVLQIDVEDWDNKGKVMGILMPKFKGIADGKLVNKIIMEHLSIMQLI